MQGRLFSCPCGRTVVTVAVGMVEGQFKIGPPGRANEAYVPSCVDADLMMHMCC